MPSERLGLRVSRTYLPLMRMGLCLDCEVCFELGVATCPACGSETWVPLGRFLETARAKRVVHVIKSLGRPGPHPARERASAKHFIIVARDREPLYRHFSESLAGNDSVTVVLDRRQGERRSRAEHPGPERRRSDRRWRTIHAQLRVLGWAVVRVDIGS